MSSDATKNKIVKALTELIKTTPLEKVSVSDVAKKANVSRQTFYYHFTSMFDIFDWFIRTHCRHPNGANSGIHAASPAVCIIDLCELFKANREIVLEFRRVYYEEFSGKVRCYIMRAVHEVLVYVFPDNVNKDDLEALARFFTDAYVGVITRWFKADMSYDVGKTYRGIYSALEVAVGADILKKAVDNIDIAALRRQQ